MIAARMTSSSGGVPSVHIRQVLRGFGGVGDCDETTAPNDAALRWCGARKAKLTCHFSAGYDRLTPARRGSNLGVGAASARPPRPLVAARPNLPRSVRRFVERTAQ